MRRISFIILFLIIMAHSISGSEVIDYGDASSFANALNRGEDTVGKIVQFTVTEYHPESAVGYNLWADNHLNFISAKAPDASAGDSLVVKVTGVSKYMQSWLINYEIVEDATVAETTAFITPIPSPTPALITPAADFYNNNAQNTPDIWVPAIENMTLIGEYTYPAYNNDFGYVLFFRNDTGKDYSFKVQATARDAYGNILGVADDYAFSSSGYDVGLHFIFSGVNFYEVYGINYAMSDQSNGFTKPAQGDIAFQTSDTGNNIVVTITNTGEEKLYAVFCDLYYYKGDRIVGVDNVPFTSCDFSPGVPLTSDTSKPSYLDFDSIRVCIEGYRL